MSKPPEFPGSRRLRRVATPATSKGRAYEGAFEAVGSILISTGIGYWVDHRYGTEPWGVLIGAAIGFAAFVVRLVRLGQRAYADAASGADDESQAEAAGRGGGPGDGPGDGRAGAGSTNGNADANQDGADADGGSVGRDVEREERS